MMRALATDGGTALVLVPGRQEAQAARPLAPQSLSNHDAVELAISSTRLPAVPETIAIPRAGGAETPSGDLRPVDQRPAVSLG